MGRNDKRDPELSHRSSVVTDKGVRVDLAFYVDTERENDGYRVDRIDANVDGQPAGYIKLSYIPASYWDQRYGDPVSYAGSHFTGSHYVLRDLLDAGEDLDDLSRQQLIDVVHSERGWRSHRPDVEAMDDAQLQEAWNDLRKRLHEEYADRHAYDRARLRDQVTVAYIRTYDMMDNGRYVDGNEMDFAPTGEYHESGFAVRGPSWRRQGIGMVLYEQAAIWMADRGLGGIQASGLQQSNAKAAWMKIERKHGIERVRIPQRSWCDEPETRRRLSGETVKRNLSRPQLDHELAPSHEARRSDRDITR